jgi:cell division initiation protein
VVITPLDIKKQDFVTSFRGFNKTEVISFLEMVSQEMENLIRENLELKEKLQRASEKLASYSKIESALQNTLVASQETAEEMKNAAQDKAELIIREANAKAKELIDEAYDKLADLRREYSSLKNQKAAFLVNLRSLLESQLKLLELTEKQSEETSQTLTIKKKTELSETDVDRLVEEFTRDTEQVSQKTAIIENTITDNEKKQTAEDD